MARSPTPVLVFPVHPIVAAAPCLLAAWEVLHLHFTHELQRIHRLGPTLSSNEVLELQGEWSLLARRLDAIEAAVKARITAHAKAVGLIA